MNEKNFYSFYKLNNDEINKLKEKISEENNIRNSAPVQPISEQIVSPALSKSTMWFEWGDEISPAPTAPIKKKSASKPKVTPKPISSPKSWTPPLKTPKPVKTSTYEGIQIVNTLKKGEKVFAFFLTIVTIILFVISGYGLESLGFMLIVSTYITTRCVPINCPNNIIKFFVKLITFFAISLALVIAPLVLIAVFAVFYETFFMKHS